MSGRAAQPACFLLSSDVVAVIYAERFEVISTERCEDARRVRLSSRDFEYECLSDYRLLEFVVS